MTEPTDKPLLDEQQLDEYLKGDSSVSRQYRQLPGAGVPAELDRLVLRQAQDAVKRGSSQRPAWVRWSAPLAVAASAVLALAIVIETGVRDETMVSAPQPIQAKQQSKAEEEFAAEPEAPAAASAAAPAADSAAEAVAENHLADSARGTSPQRERAAPAAPPPPPRQEVQSPQFMPSAEPIERIETKAARIAESPPLSSPVAPLEVSSADSIAKSADAAARMLQTSALRKDAAQEEERLAAELRRAMPVADAPAPSMTYTDPEAWLKDIRQLRKDNKQEEADREWRRFLAAFPNYEVAEDDTAREAKK
ncbi:MAG TPA: hypothetical protein VGD45_31700 [Steroidobacter sp.]|uniref:hypothetical protein n=1 Tax=Steroidobacter sp. TaxID=1978227 RepID=UPI002EDABEFD